MDLGITLTVLGALFLSGLAADYVGRRTKLPRVTLLLACGIAAGSSGFDLIPETVQSWYEFLSVSALTIVAFLLGNALTLKKLKRHGKAILWVSLSIVLFTVVLVTLGLAAIGVPLSLALLLGAIASATDPAATQDAIQQLSAKGPFVDKIKGIVAIDDAWGLMVFSLILVLAHGVTDDMHLGLLGEAAYEIFGSVALGAAVGVPSAYLTGRLKEGQPQQTEALGVVFLTAGLALWAGLSFLIAGMTAGMVIANFARHHRRAFHQIENFQWPFMMLFFLLAGASLQVDAIASLGLIGGAYMVLRVVSRLIGGWVGGALAGEQPLHRNWYGPALLSQAGVAVGMALVAGREFPQYAELILTLTIGTTVVFELIGPLVAVLAFRKVGEHQTE